MKHILVTGGAGFVGSNLTLELQTRFPKTRITVLDDFRSKGDKFKNLWGFKGDLIPFNMALINWEEVFGKKCTFDAVFHIAAITENIYPDTGELMRDNVEGFRKLLEFCKKKKPTIVYASSSAVYGNPGAMPFKEDMELKPASAYGLSKALMENMAKIYTQENKGWKIVGLRYVNMYGPRESHKGIPASMIYHLAQQITKGEKPRLFKPGDQQRDQCYIKDAVNITIAALKAPRTDVYNVGSGTPRFFTDIVPILNKLLGKNVAIELIDNPYLKTYQNFTQADMTKTIKELKVKPEYTLEEGIKDYLKSGWLVPTEQVPQNTFKIQKKLSPTP